MNQLQGNRLQKNQFQETGGYAAQCTRAWVAQRWIEEDIIRGILPPAVNCFNDLHDYVDGHGYLFDKYLGETRIGSTLDWQSWSLQEIIDHIAPVCEAVDAWLKNQRLGNAVDYLPLAHTTRTVASNG